MKGHKLISILPVLTKLSQAMDNREKKNLIFELVKQRKKSRRKKKRKHTVQFTGDYSFLNYQVKRAEPITIKSIISLCVMIPLWLDNRC